MSKLSCLKSALGHFFILVLLLPLWMLFGCTTSSQLGLADHLVKEGRYQEAVAEYLRVIQEHPGTESARKAPLRIGRLYDEQLKRPEDAARIYQDVIDNNPGGDEALEALWLLGMHYYHAGVYPQALPRFVQIVMDFPQTERSQDARLQVAACYEGMERYQEAVAGYEDYTRHFPSASRIPEVKLRQAELYEQQLQRRDRAVVLYREIEQAFPGTEQAGIASARLEQLQAVDHSPQTLPEGGLRDIGPPTRPGARKILAQWDVSPTFGYNARELLRGGRNLFGGEELQESLAGDGALLDDAVYNMGLMFYMTGDYKRSGTCLERALELGLREPDLFLRLGLCYREVGDTKRARTMFAELNRLDPRAVDRLMLEADRSLTEGELDAARRRYESLQQISPERDEKIAQRLAQINARQ